MMTTNWYLTATLALLFSCESKKEWFFKENIPLEGISPLGIIKDNETLIISDPDNNRIVRTDLNGIIKEEWTGIQRPMHIDLAEGKIYATGFINDRVVQLENGKLKQINLDIEFDAPAGIDVEGKIMAIAGFYNHKVYLVTDSEVIEIGGEGHEDARLYYPTDVKLYKGKVVVADAYNNRVQVFDQKGEFLKVIGWRDEINVALGVDVYEDRIYVTDFHNSRVLVYDFEGVLINIFEGYFDLPTDLSVSEDLMFIANYGGNAITVFSHD